MFWFQWGCASCFCSFNRLEGFTIVSQSELGKLRYRVGYLIHASNCFPGGRNFSINSQDVPKSIKKMFFKIFFLQITLFRRLQNNLLCHFLHLMQCGLDIIDAADFIFASRNYCEILHFYRADTKFQPF